MEISQYRRYVSSAESTVSQLKSLLKNGSFDRKRFEKTYSSMLQYSPEGGVSYDFLGSRITQNILNDLSKSEKVEKHVTERRLKVAIHSLEIGIETAEREIKRIAREKRK